MNTNQIIKEEEKEESYFCNKCEIIRCRGTKCRLHHSDGYRIHCLSCYSSDYSFDEHDNTPVEKPDLDTIKIIQCSGSKCRRHRSDGRGIHCTSCFEEWEPY